MMITFLYWNENLLFSCQYLYLRLTSCTWIVLTIFMNDEFLLSSFLYDTKAFLLVFILNLRYRLHILVPLRKAKSDSCFAIAFRPSVSGHSIHMISLLFQFAIINFCDHFRIFSQQVQSNVFTNSIHLFTNSFAGFSDVHRFQKLPVFWEVKAQPSTSCKRVDKT